MSIICGILILLGSAFTLATAIGILRLPDLPLRMHAATKAGTMSVGLIILSLALYFGTGSVAIKSIMIVLFIFSTVPIGAHLIIRAAYFINLPFWDGTIVDELRDHYDTKTHELRGEDD